tara:strand:- start:13735 stop:14100 length:366 start_codon:yes stop_codon:yes gene_type:complete
MAKKNKKYKILIPKAGSNNEFGTETKLYEHDEVVDANETWQSDLMETFVENGWAMEIKADSADESVEVEAEIKRARNEKGQLIGDDPDTPDINEAWEGGEAPKTAKKSTKKKTTKKKTTKK